ncbi:MAG: type II toxin-antitoxin system RelE/ParE family toxin [Clostridia bacterium]|nr:type II toxin-antitoxin system RelE/ParE family toxin [Clostridia bacterium]
MENTILNFEKFPYMGKNHINNQIRYLIYKNFYIFYEIHENKNIINIIRIVHKNKVIF